MNNRIQAECRREAHQEAKKSSLEVQVEAHFLAHPFREMCCYDVAEETGIKLLSVRPSLTHLAAGNDASIIAVRKDMHPAGVRRVTYYRKRVVGEIPQPNLFEGRA